MADPDASFSAGLLHDIGKIIISCFLETEFAQYKEARAKDTTKLDFEIEQEQLGFTHADVGGFLTETWKIPEKLTEAIANHHNITEVNKDNAFSIIVCMANWLSKKTFFEPDQQYKVGPLNPNIVEFLEINDEIIENLEDSLRTDYAGAETFMQLVGM